MSRTVGKALDILELLNEHGSLGVSNISKELELDKSTIYRLVSTLRRRGYVDQDPESKKYSNTFKLFQMGNIEISRLGIREVAHPFLERLAEETRETINLAVLAGKQVMYIDKIESSKTVKVDLGIGRTLPAYASSLGKVILANMSSEKVCKMHEMDTFTQFTPKSIMTIGDLLVKLEFVRQLGYCIEHEELIPGLSCVAVPIKNHERKVIAAVSIAFPTYRYKDNKKELENIIERLLLASKHISHKFGFLE